MQAKFLYTSGVLKLKQILPTWEGTIKISKIIRSFLLAHIGEILEITLIVIWALWLGRNYFNFDPLVIPQGGDFPHQIQNTFIWRLFPRCGVCVLWNGFYNGGFPAFADLQSSALNPLIAVGALLWGAVNSAKFGIICALIIVGLAQWWMARVMHLGWVARLWIGLMAPICGHLGGTLHNGATNVTISLAFASLLLAPLMDLGINHNRRVIPWISVIVSFLLVSGQGYIQVVSFVAIALALIVFMFDEKGLKPIWIDFAWAGVLGLLLSGVFLVPLFHFFPYFTKESTVGAEMGQPLIKMITLLLVPSYADGDLSLFVGWIPLILAFSTLGLAAKPNWRQLWFLLLGFISVLLITSSDVLGFLSNYIPQISYARVINLATPLAIPFLLGLSAWGVDLLFHLNWPNLVTNFNSGQSNSLSTRWLILPIALIIAVRVAYPTSQFFLFTVPVDKPKAVSQALMTHSSQWVLLPTPDWQWPIVLISQGDYKITDVFRAWRWIGRDIPLPFREITDVQDIKPATYIGQVDRYDFLEEPKNQYASVKTDRSSIPCKAEALGGKIDVTCETLEKGLLTVTENAWSGWYVWVDGKLASLDAGQWLSVAAPTGKHIYQFRYYPWDVFMGILITLLGVVLAIQTGRKMKRQVEDSHLANSL